jgi:hypothetical protein
MWKIFRMCSICGEDISFVCKVNVRCGHHVHHECRLNLVPFTKCSICNRIIINKLDVHLSDQDEFCHKRCETNARRYYPPCPVEGCGMALYRHHVITNKQCQQLIVELEGKTFEERMAIYLSYGFREDELGGGELDEETWKKIQTIISASLQEKETEGQVMVTRETKPKPVITPPKTYEPRELAPGERYKPPNKSRRPQERGASLKTLVPHSVKDRVHVSPQEDFALFSQGPI